MEDLTQESAAAPANPVAVAEDEHAAAARAEAEAFEAWATTGDPAAFEAWAQAGARKDDAAKA